MAIELKLYLLELANHKYYVGQSEDPEFRYLQHLGKQGSLWTRRHKPLRIAKRQSVMIEDFTESMLYENWMTLQAMERYGWENVRGGEFLIVESNLLKIRLKHIYDFENNKIRYYVTDMKKYLFGQCADWLIYVLELADNYFYIGSCKHLGKALGPHFDGTGIYWTRIHPVVKVSELIIVKPDEGNYIEVKDKLKLDYINRYGWDNVKCGQMPKRSDFS